MQQRTSLTDQTSGCRTSASAGDFLMSRNKHVAAFLRTMDLTAPFVCRQGTLREASAPYYQLCRGTPTYLCTDMLYPAHDSAGWHIKHYIHSQLYEDALTSKFMTSTVSREAISGPPTAQQKAALTDCHAS